MSGADPTDAVLAFSSGNAGKPPRGKILGRFLCGPIPMAWLDEARRQRGKAIHVAIELWHWSGVRKSKTVRLNLSRMIRFGVTRPTASRALQDLESAGLVKVERLPGRAPLVTILDVSSVPMPSGRGGPHP